MISTGEDVKGQGVGAAYYEIVNLLKKYAKNEISLSFNKDTNCDINHVHTVHPNCFTRMALSKIPSCMHVHFLPETIEGSIDLPPLIQDAYYKYVIKMYKLAQELIVVNPIFIDPLAAYGIDKDKITYIPNVANSDNYFPMEKDKCSSYYEKYKLDRHKFTVIGVGQVQTRKGVMDFVEIAKSMPDIQFIWAGGFSFGAITDGYEDLKIVYNNPPSNVKFLGIIDREDMNYLYNMADLLLMTSYNELFPMAIIEAVNSGLPILLRDLDLYKKIYFTDYLKASSNKGFIDIISNLKTQPELIVKAKDASKKIASDYSEETVSKLWIDYYYSFADRWKDYKRFSKN